MLRMLVQHVVQHLSLTEPIGFSGGNVLNREGGGPWSIVFYGTGDVSLDYMGNVFKKVLQVVRKKTSDTILFEKAQKMAKATLETVPKTLLEAVDRDWHEIRSTRHVYNRREEWSSLIDDVSVEFVLSLIDAADKFDKKN